MPKKYILSSGKELNETELNEILAKHGIDVDTFLSINPGTKIVDAEEIEPTTLGKIKDSANAVPTVESENNTESSSEDGSSESKPKLDSYYVTIEDLKTDEATAEANLNKKLARLGIKSEQSLIGDALTFTTEAERNQRTAGGLAVKDGILDYVIGSVSDLFNAVRIGEDKTDEELQQAANTINAYIKENGDLNFIEEARNRNFGTYEKDFIPYVTPEELNEEQVSSLITKEKIEKFSKIKSNEQKTTGGQYTYGTYVKEATLSDFENEEEFLEYQGWKKGEPLNENTEQEILTWDLDRKDKYKKTRSSEWANKSDDETRMDILALAAYDEEQVKSYFDIKKLADKAQEQFEWVLMEYEENPSIETYDIAFEANNALLQQSERLQDIQNKIVKENIDQRYEYVPIAISDFNRNYSRLEQLSTSFKSTGVGLTYGLATISKMASDPYYWAKSSAFNAREINEQTGLVDTAIDLDKESERYQTSPEIGEIKSLRDAGRWAANSSMQMIPSLAMATAGGTAALPMFFLSGFGGSTLETAKKQQEAAVRMSKNSKILDETPDMSQLEIATIENEMQKDADLLGLSNWKVIGTAGLHGIAEVAFEQVGTIAILRSVKKGIQGMPSWVLKEGFKDVGLDVAQFSAKEIGGGILQEGFSELGTTFVQNFGDIYMLGEDKNFFEGGLESFAGGALMGGSMKSLNAFKAVKMALASEMANKEQQEEMRSIVQQLRDLTGQHNLQSVADISAMGISLPKELQAQLDALTRQGFELEDQIIQGAAAGYSAETLFEIGEINRKQRKLNNQLISASVNQNIGAGQLKIYEAQLRAEFDKLEKQKQGIFNNTTAVKEQNQKVNIAQVGIESTMGYRIYNQVMLNESILEVEQNYEKLDPALRQEGFDQAKIKLQEQGIEEPSKDQIKTEARTNYIDSFYGEKIEKGEANARQMAEDLGLEVNIKSFSGPDKTKNILEAYAEAGATKEDLVALESEINNGLFNGVFVESGTGKGGTIIIDKDASIKNKAIGVFAHEVLHAYAYNNFGDAKSTKAGEDLLGYLKRNDSDMYAKVTYRIDQSYTKKDSEGNTVKDQAYYEEAMNAMSDVIADGQQLKTNTVNQVRLFVNKIMSDLGSTVQIKPENGADAVVFVENFNKKAHFGKNVKIEDKDLRQKPSDVDKKTKIKSSKKSKTKIYDAKVNLDRFTPPETRTDFKTKEEFRDSMAFWDAYSEMSGTDLLDSHIKKGMNITFLENNPTYIEDVKEGLLNRYEKNYDITKNTLFGWLMGTKTDPGVLYRAKGDVAKKYGAQPSGISLDIPTSEGGSKIELASAEDADSVIELEEREIKEQKEVKKPLKDRITFLDATKQALIDLKSVLVKELKYKLELFDKSKSKNQFTTDFVRDIHQALQLEGFKIIRKHMKATNKTLYLYNRFLEENYVNILEGLTTTYLAKAFPQAVEKYIVGKGWTTNWKGAEKGTKNGDIAHWNASEEGPYKGTTSGPQKIRRVKNIKNAIPFQEFRGKYIKGDKIPQMPTEALARQLAAEIGIDLFVEELKNPESDIAKDFFERQDLVRGIAKENASQDVLYQLERPGVKFSKTGYTPLDNARLNMVSYIGKSSMKDIDVIVQSPEKDKEYMYLKASLEKAHEDYMKIGYIKAKNRKLYSEFKQRGFTEKNKGLQNLIDKIIEVEKGKIHNILSVPSQSISISNLRPTSTDDAKTIDKKNKKREQLKTDSNEVTTGYVLSQLIGKNPVPTMEQAEEVVNDSIKLFQGGLSQTIYLKNQEFYDYWLQPLLKTLKDSGVDIDPKKWALAPAVPQGKTLTFKGEKITSTLLQEAGATDIANVITSKEAIITNTIKKDLRDDASDKIREIYLKYAEWLKQNRDDGVITNRSVGIITNILHSGSMRAAGKALAKLDGVLLFDGMFKPIDYTYEHLLPTNYLKTQFALFVMGTGSAVDLKNAVESSTVVIIPKIVAKQVDKIYQSSLKKGFKLGDNVLDFRYLVESVQGDLNKLGMAFNSIDIQKITKDSNFIRREVKNEVVAKKIENQANKKGKTKFSKSGLSTNMNSIIEQTKGLKANVKFGDVSARNLGRKQNKYRFFVPPSAEDFTGLMYDLMGKGKEGESHAEFFNETLVGPYRRGIAKMESVRQEIKKEFVAAIKNHKQVAKKLRKKIPSGDFTYDQAIRVYLWTNAGYNVPGITKADKFRLNAFVKSRPDLVAFARDLSVTSRQEKGWVKPDDNWNVTSLLGDLNNLTERVNRRKYLAEFEANSQEIFSNENMNKLRVVLGNNWVEAMEDSLFRMRNGTNRPSGSNRITNSWNNWVNNSVGAIMFFNRRSATLQLLSSVNFINWSDNNPLNAAIAFANQKQFWTDFATIWNSSKLKERRSGLKTDVNESEIANAVENAKNPATAFLAYALKKGFTLTQIGDSFAIASGGSTFYRNRINTYIKQGLTKEEAEAKAFVDFSKISDENQQSADPSLISQQQASILGRLVLTFQNTPAQYMRLTKKAIRDLINGRGDPKTHISKIIYYTAVQNFIFSALQQGLFAFMPGFGEEEEEEESNKKLTPEEEQAAEDKKLNDKMFNILNGMSDTVLKGSGLYGAVVSTIKNIIIEYNKQQEKGNFLADHAYTILAALSLAPPLGSKGRKLYQAIQTEAFDEDVITERGWSVMKDGRLNLSPRYSSAGSLASAALNMPADRIVDEVNSITEAFDNRNSTWQKLALALGWKTWNVGAKNEEHDLIKASAKEKRKKAGIEKGKITRKKTSDANKVIKEEKRKKEADYILSLTPSERTDYYKLKRKEAIEEKLRKQLEKNKK